jgi:hypothetical protein
MMWSPGLAAILTQLIATRSLRGLGWRLGPVRWLVIAYILPLATAVQSDVAGSNQPDAGIDRESALRAWI